MAVFVVDASVALAWCFEDEASNWSEGLQQRLRSGDIVIVPAHWPCEVSNGLLVGLRRQRIALGKPEKMWDQFALLPIEAEPSPLPDQSKTILALCYKHRLTVYDAAYLELAHRKQLPLATLDQDLRKAATTERVTLL